jgi:hypothetical protein
MPLSKALNPNLLQGCHTTMADPVKQHISLHISVVCDNKTYIQYQLKVWTPQLIKGFFFILKRSKQMLRICGNSFKTVGKAFLMKLLYRMPRVCKTVIKAKGGYFEESQK